jgi:predicted homoserine dehydrogenase-like protein
MYEVNKKLEELDRVGSPITIGLIGAGQMGTDIIAQVDQMKGVIIPVIVDLTIEQVKRAMTLAESAADLASTNDPVLAERAVNSGKTIATTNWKLATALPQIQVIIDATGSPQMGAAISLDAINHKKHIVMMNVECDVTIGPILRQMADNAGVIYSLAAGDEPAAILELYRFAEALGFTIVAGGKGKNNPLDFYATPNRLEDQAKQRNMSPRMLVEFFDGTKTMVEMAAVSNATGLIPDVRGMHGAKSTVEELPRVFCSKNEGGILENTGVVDFAIGVHPGVFVIVTTKNKRLKESLIQRDMGYGPNYLLFRPYHLCSIEVPLTAAQAVIYRESSGQPMKKLTSECIVIAKKNLKRGEVLDNIGGYCYRGSIEQAGIARNEGMLPLGLAKGAVLKKDVQKDEVITYDMVEIVEESVLLQLRKIQDALISP